MMTLEEMKAVDIRTVDPAKVPVPGKKVYAASSSCGINIQTSCVADLITDSIWKNSYIWSDCHQDSGNEKDSIYVCAGCRRCSWT